MRKVESDSLDEGTRLEHLHYYWGAKEALYKCYGRRRLDFKEHILIEPFEYAENGKTTGTVIKDDFKLLHVMSFDISCCCVFFMQHWVFVNLSILLFSVQCKVTCFKVFIVFLAFVPEKHPMKC